MQSIRERDLSGEKDRERSEQHDCPDRKADPAVLANGNEDENQNEDGYGTIQG